MKKTFVTVTIRRPASSLLGGGEEVETSTRLLYKGSVCVDGHWYKPTEMDGKLYVTVLPLPVEKAIATGGALTKGAGIALAVGMVGASVLLGNHRRGI